MKKRKLKEVKREVSNIEMLNAFAYAMAEMCSSHPPFILLADEMTALCALATDVVFNHPELLKKE